MRHGVQYLRALLPSTDTPSIATRWALTTAAAFVFTVVAHELAHGVGKFGALPFTPAWSAVGSLAGPMGSLLIVASSMFWIARRNPSRGVSRWAIAIGLTSAVRIFLVWLVAAPFLHGSAPRATFDERLAAEGLGIPIVPLLVVETLLAAAAIVWIILAVPRDERRQALLGIAGAIVLVGTIVFVVNPRI